MHPLCGRSMPGGFVLVGRLFWNPRRSQTGIPQDSSQENCLLRVFCLQLLTGVFSERMREMRHLFYLIE